MTVMRQPHRVAVQVVILGPGGIKGQGTQNMVIKRMIVSSLLTDSGFHRMSLHTLNLGDNFRYPSDKSFKKHFPYCNFQKAMKNGAYPN